MKVTVDFELVRGESGRPLLHAEGRVGYLEHSDRDDVDAFVERLCRGDLEAVELAESMREELVSRAGAEDEAHRRQRERRTGSNLPDRLLGIALRNRRRILFVTDCPALLGLSIRQNAAVEVSDGGAASAPNESTVERIFPPDSALPRRKCSASLLSTLDDVRLVVLALQDWSFADLVAAIDEIGATGVPVLPIVFASRVLEIGPLLLGGDSEAFVLARTDGEPLDPGDRRAFEAFSSGRLGSADPAKLAGVASELERWVLEPSAGDLFRVARLSTDGTTRQVDLAWNRTRLMKRQVPGDLWSIENFLGEPLDLAPLREWFVRGSLLSINDFLRADAAEAVHGSLDATMAWELHQRIDRGFMMHHHNIYAVEDFSPTLSLLQIVFNSQRTRDWVFAFTAIRCDGNTTATPSWYMPGDHSTPHNDRVGERAVAFILHLTKNWDPSWGGDLVWCPTGDVIPPTFNTLSIFDVDAEQMHFVRAVTPTARGKRIAFNGWWTVRGRVPRPYEAPHVSLEGGRIAARPPFARPATGEALARS